MKQRVVVLGCGDTGLLTAVRLPRRAEVTVVAPKGGMVSGQELGLRLARPATWLSTSVFAADRYRGLRGSTVLHGKAHRVDPDARTITVDLAAGGHCVVAYDVLVIATGATNGFWRTDALESLTVVKQRVAEQAQHLAAAETVAVVGGGPSGVSVAYNLKRAHPATTVHLVHRGPALLPAYPVSVRAELHQRLVDVGVRVHLSTEARRPTSPPDGPTPGPLVLEDAESTLAADAVVWTLGRPRPNTQFLPTHWLDDDGFVRVDETLAVRGTEAVFAVGDVAATDPQRSSARNAGHAVAAANVRAVLRGRRPRRRFRTPPAHRWGSILGLQPEGLTVYLPTGHSLRFPPWLARTLLYNGIVRWVLFRGIRQFSVLLPRAPAG